MNIRADSSWIVLLAVVLLVSFACQLHPPLISAIWQGTDFRTWTPMTWTGLNLATVLLLLGLRSKNSRRLPLAKTTAAAQGRGALQDRD